MLDLHDEDEIWVRLMMCLGLYPEYQMGTMWNVQQLHVTLMNVISVLLLRVVLIDVVLMFVLYVVLVQA